MFRIISVMIHWQLTENYPILQQQLKVGKKNLLLDYWFILRNREK